MRAKRNDYVPEKGDRVVMRWDTDDSWGPGTIIAAGPHVSTWRCDRDKQERHRINSDYKPTRR